MNIQFNTDKNIAGSAERNTYLSTVISKELSRYNELITRIEVHLSDENSHKEGQNDKRCLIEARLEGLQPIVVSTFSDTIEQSVKGALDKLKAAIDTVRGRLNNH